nr:MAG TPA: hypothetical protein [Caudoviricetes sp.]DAT19398.1 MAG TPA: hypothetical protein [Caudoviricetes sp.]
MPTTVDICTDRPLIARFNVSIEISAFSISAVLVIPNSFMRIHKLFMYILHIFKV